ncbi:MAG: hypothetical protein QOF24_2510 [Verrucomicrobiota bacterium]
MVRSFMSQASEKLNQRQHNTYDDTEDNYPYRLLIPLIVAAILAAVL